MNSYLYVIRLLDDKVQVKIGITVRPFERMKQLEVGTKTELLSLVEVKENRAHEKRLHKQLHEKRVPQTEWFRLGDTEQQALLGEVRALGQEVPLPAKAARRAPSSKPRQYDGPRATPLPPDWVKPKPAPKPKLPRSEQEKEEARKQRERDKRARERAEVKAEKERLQKVAAAEALLRQCRALLTAKELEAWDYFEEFWSGCEGDEWLTELEAVNPWVEEICRPDWRECWLTEEGEVAGMSVSIYFTEPSTKMPGVIHINPPAQPGESDSVGICAGWLLERHGRQPESWEEVEEWLWMLMELPKGLWPAEVCSRARRIDRERRKYEQLAALEAPLSATALKQLLSGLPPRPPEEGGAAA